MPTGQQSGPFSIRRDASRRRRGGRLLLALLLVLEQAAAGPNVPVNGRPQRMIFASAPVQAIAAAAYDQQLDHLASQNLLDRDPALLERVRRIADRIIIQAVALKPEAAQWPWEIHLAGGSGTDAYCMAGGKILVGEAFLREQQFSDDELAALLAHEIAHAIAGHVREQLSAVPGLDPDYSQFGVEDVIALLGWDLSVTLRLSGLSRLHELEADDIGIHLAALAGYDPHAAVQFYRKLGSLDSGTSLIESHLASDERLQAVRSFAVYAEPLYRAARTTHREAAFVAR